MKRNVIAGLLVPHLLLGSAARADDADDADDSGYAEQGTFEVGGSIAAAWSDDAFTFTASPTAGYFIVDRFELTAELIAEYSDVDDDDTGEPSRQRASPQSSSRATITP